MARSDMTVELTLTDAAKMLIAEAREQLELNDKERAVIEAARALHAAMIQSYDGEPVPLAVMVEFKTAVEALQEVEQ